MPSIDFDTSELRTLAAGMRAIPGQLTRHITPVINRAGLNVKNELRENMAGSKHFKGVAHAISYDILDDGMTVEVGPSSEAGSPGNLANIAYFGGANGGGGTVADPIEALEHEQDGFLKALADLTEKLL